MTRYFAIAAAALLALTVATPSQARHKTYRHHHHHHHHAPNPFAADIRFDHNYGPGALPGTFALYDGPLRANCKQGAAAYRGQDGRRHACH